jgi:2-polyprenyl-3-methyl-5-hydroxy-6-metoxy-1,4-benzoquinol methylase
VFGRDIRERCCEAEILDGLSVAEDVRERCYADLARMHRWLGNHHAILECLRCDTLPVETVLDIGCGHGALLQEMQTKLGVRAIGIDLNPPRRWVPVAILRADAVRDRLPAADVAVSVAMVHHLSAQELAALIRNVGRACRRFVILDLVRRRIPLTLFRSFVAPFVNPINVQDGIRSLNRAFTPEEMRQIVAGALAGTAGRFRHVVAPLYTRQIVDISYAPEDSGTKGAPLLGGPHDALGRILRTNPPAPPSG